MTELILSLSKAVAVLQTIPASAWTALMGSLLTLAGVLVANRHSRHQLRVQLEHDAAERRKQRTVELRRTVYLSAAEEMVKANAVVGRIPTTAFGNANIAQELIPFFAAMMKLQMVGEPKTALLANGLASSYGEALGSAIARALPISEVVSAIDLKTERYEVVQVEIQRLLAAMNALSESGVDDKQRLDALNQAFTLNMQLAAEIEVERTALRERHTELMVDATRRVAPIAGTLAMEFLPLFVEIRRELDLGGNVDDFRAMLDSQVARMDSMVDQVRDAVEAHGLNIDSDSRSSAQPAKAD